MRVRLVPFPDSDDPGLDAITVTVSRRGQEMSLVYRIEGRTEIVVWPAKSGDGRADDLWRHTCFEAFVETPDGYAEFNLSPSGRWASYRFDSYRAGMRPADDRAWIDGCDVDQKEAVLSGRIVLPVGARRLALSAVIENLDGRKTYWALAHPSDKPDFHHPDSFVLELP